MSPHLATREAEVDMKSTRHIRLLAAVSLALTILPAIRAEPRCPGNTASVTPRFVQHALIVIPGESTSQARSISWWIPVARLRLSIHRWPRSSTSGLKAGSDGKKIAFQSGRSGSLEVWVCEADGSNAVQLTSFGGPDVTTPRLSPDGERVGFDSNAAGEFDIYVVSVNGGKPQRLTMDPANDGNPSWSHDGQWIYFDSARTRAQQVWKMPANGGEAVQVTKDGGYAPLESPDGKFLYYTKALFSGSLWRIPVEGGEASKVLDGLTFYENLAIADGGLYFVPTTNKTGDSSIQFLSFATNKISKIATFEKALLWGLTVSPDGKWIVSGQERQSGSELMLVENFR
jgi:Tol biopolymer transport system component